MGIYDDPKGYKVTKRRRRGFPVAGVAIGVVVVLLVVGLTSYLVTNFRIRRTLNDFRDACNEGDVGGMLDCIDPDIADPLKAALVIFNIASTQYEETVTEAINTIFGDMAGQDIPQEQASELMESVKLTRVFITPGISKASVKCRAEFEFAGTTFKRDIRIRMVKKRGDWYIAGVESAEKRSSK